MIFWKNILKWCLEPKNFRWILLVIIFFLVMIIFNQCQKQKKDENIYNQNITALQDTVRLQKNKVGELESVKASYIMDLNELKKVNKKLVEELEKEKGDVKVVTRVINEIIRDTIKITNDIISIKPYEYGLNWFWEKDTIGYYHKISGQSRFFLDTTGSKYTIIDKGTTIYEDNLRLTIYSFLRYYEDKYELVVRSPYKNVKFDIESNIDPNFINNKQDRWVVGPTVNVGFSGYILDTKLVDNLTWSLGFGITYRLFGF